MASVSYRQRKKGGSWEYRYKYVDMYTGKPREHSNGGFKKKKDAQEAYEAWIATFENGKPNVDPLFKDYARKWFEAYRHKYRPNTVRSREQSLTRIEKSMKNIRLSNINYDTVQKYLNDLADQNFSKSIISSDKSMINLVVTKAIREKYFKFNPLDGVDMPSTKPVQKTKYWSMSQLVIFLNYLTEDVKKRDTAHRRPRFYMVLRILAEVSILAGAGPRIGELGALDVTDYHPDTHYLSFHHNLTMAKFSKNGEVINQINRDEIMKTTSSYRDVPLPEMAWKNLEWWLSERNNFLNFHGATSSAMFPSISGRYQSLNCIRSSIKHSIKEAQLPMIKIHGFRHTYASFLSESDVTSKEAQILLGHSDIHTTLNIYTHISETEKQNAVNKLDAMIKGANKRPKEIDHDDTRN